MNIPTVFKSQTRVWFTYSLMLVAFLCATYISFIFAQQGSLLKGFAVLLCSTIIVTLSVLISLSQQSDIVIDELSISRVMFGRTWQYIQWKNVREIHVGLTPRFSKKPVKCCWIYPILESRSKCRFIAICYDRNDIDALLELVNHYVSKYDIKIMSRMPGEEMQLTCLTK